MSQYVKYAKYYDLFYDSKSYDEEAAYLAKQIECHIDPPGSGGLSLLEFGCGTGRHAVKLAKMGCKVTGVDLSVDMIRAANARVTPALKENLKFLVGDAKVCVLAREFDVVLANFHVASYQIKNSEIRKFVSNAANHIRHQGLYIFDFWYAPGVLSTLPEKRTRTYEDDQIKITRHANPRLIEYENLVEVTYFVNVYEKSCDSHEDFSETHKMRYFSIPEIKWILEAAGLKILEATESFSKSPPRLDTWSVTIVAKKSS